MYDEIQPGEFHHNSHLDFFRTPFGAMPCGAKVSLRLLAPLGFRGDCTLRIWENGAEVLLSMDPEPAPDEWATKAMHTIFVAHYTLPDEPCLIWYYFCISTAHEAYFYGNNKQSLGGVGDIYGYAPNAYQITVCHETRTPDWWKRGSIYQIFPDRFRNGNPDGRVNSPKPGSLLQASWYDRPSYQKDPDGKIMNWIFAGGNLKGVTEKLDYLQDLGISILYFNPIFKARSSHRYDTGDYKTIDPMLGTEEDFALLVQAARARGISILLDGVFSHTGMDSLYFNKLGNYGSGGAYQDKESPYYDWYTFTNYPAAYKTWWDFPDLPNLNKENPSLRDFFCNDDDSVVRHWMRRGVMGFRLDVADELPDSFIKLIRKTVKEENPDGVLIGEVWEDASNKTSYNVLREYYHGDELDGVMNYPFYESLLRFALGELSGQETVARLMSIVENYPRENLLGCMTLLGSHDRPRPLSILGGVVSERGEDRIVLTEGEKQAYHLPEETYHLASRRLSMLAALQMALPGTPSLYYGDEAGLQGFMDPYNRGTYPWGYEDETLRETYRCLLHLRRDYLAPLMGGALRPLPCAQRLLAFRLTQGTVQAFIFANASEAEQAISFSTAASLTRCLELVEGGLLFSATAGAFSATIPPLSTRIYLAQADQPSKEERAAGILLHPTSLPSPWRVGDLGETAFHFVDHLAQGGQRLWQILPLSPPTLGESPYQALSCYAGNPLLLSMEALVDNGLLEQKELTAALTALQQKTATIPAHLACMEEARQSKETLLHLAHKRFAQGGRVRASDHVAYAAFMAENDSWLPDFSLFMALKEQFGGVAWQDWPDETLRCRELLALAQARIQQAQAISYHCFVQFLFESQWRALKRYANGKGVRLLGDVALYLGPDSADVWANPTYFSLDTDGFPTEVAGVPPDYFSAEGQNWGNPVYHWDLLAAQDYAWWIARLRHAMERHDLLRLDHFRGFEAYWSIPAGKKAAEGQWHVGPGLPFFHALRNAFGELPFLAEDLGFLTPAVLNLKNIFSLPGMEIYQFSPLLQEQSKSASLRNSAVYTGTHDNETLAAWLRARATEPLDTVACAAAVDEIIAALYASQARWVILPLQDLLGLGEEARMNLPGSIGGQNWRWMLTNADWDALPAAFDKLRVWTDVYAREGV